METLRIASENPKIDQWKLISQYSYPANINRYFEKYGFSNIDEETIVFIAGCIRQAEAYYTTAENSPLEISPLLIFYGAANLLIGVATLITGERLPIENHGIHTIIPSKKPLRVSDIKIKPINAKSGALQHLSNVFSPNCFLDNGTEWTVEEILGSIPDLRRDFENCYTNSAPFTIPVEIVKRKNYLLDRITINDLSRFSNPNYALEKINNLDKTYLPYQITQEYVILNRKLNSEEIGTYSIYGQKYLEIAHLKNKRLINPSQLILLYMGLFSLGYISRYKPDFWHTFVESDKTGEKFVIEQFLDIALRFLPNLTLNHINRMRIQFVSETKGILDLSRSEIFENK